jgi:putative two-component system response regulator
MIRNPVETQSREMFDAARRMAILAEHRDADVAHHIDRIRGYCAVLARGLDLSPQEGELVAAASMLHDIGKAMVPFAVLQKTDALTEKEWEQIKQHTLAGAEHLRGAPSPVLQLGEVIALTHHERWDGSGYPYGVAGEDIPLSGRICALADVFDALTTNRPYKEEVSVNEALRLIRSASGALFDPQVVDVFVENFEELTLVRSHNR